MVISKGQGLLVPKQKCQIRPLNGFSNRCFLMLKIDKYYALNQFCKWIFKCILPDIKINEYYKIIVITVYMLPLLCQVFW